MKRLEDDAGGQRAVADDGDRVAVGVADQLVADLQPQGGRRGAAGVAGHEQVEGALGRVGIAHQARPWSGSCAAASARPVISLWG